MNVASSLGVQDSLIGTLLCLPSNLETTFLGPKGWYAIITGQKRLKQAPDLQRRAKSRKGTVSQPPYIFQRRDQKSRKDKGLSQSHTTKIVKTRLTRQTYCRPGCPPATQLPSLQPGMHTGLVEVSS